MKRIFLIGVLLATTSTSAPANPWDLVPPTPPYKNLADEIKATSQPGQPSALNPSCAGMTGDQCVRSEQSSDNSRPMPMPMPMQPSGPPERGRK
jgi:hypothetical protein